MSEDLKTNVEWTQARANVYGLLAEVFRSDPSSAFLSHLKEPDTIAALESLGCSLWDGLWDELPPSSLDQLREDLAVEYTRLFIGPGPRISPHQSMNVDARFGEANELWSDETVAVKKFMEAAGVSIRDDFSGMPDHFTAEFEFMQQLVEAEAQAWQADDKKLAYNILRIEESFYNEHLSRWVMGFCDKVIEFGDLPFYPAFARVTKGFLDFEKENLQTALASGEASAA